MITLLTFSAWSSVSQQLETSLLIEKNNIFSKARSSTFFWKYFHPIRKSINRCITQSWSIREWCLKTDIIISYLFMHAFLPYTDKLCLCLSFDRFGYIPPCFFYHKDVWRLKENQSLKISIPTCNLFNIGLEKLKKYLLLRHDFLSPNSL